MNKTKHIYKKKTFAKDSFTSPTDCSGWSIMKDTYLYNITKKP